MSIFQFKNVKLLSIRLRKLGSGLVNSIKIIKQELNGKIRYCWQVISDKQVKISIIKLNC
jgi:hypothetical protein